VPPDTTAAIFWLKNRDPARWRDVWQLEHVTGKYVISDKPMTEEEWIKERATVIDGEATEVSRRLLPMRFPTPEQTNKPGRQVSKISDLSFSHLLILVTTHKS
jgi:hypothetical protein